MDEDIELAITCPDGIIDCRLEPQRTGEEPLYYSATILYPNTVNGYSRSEIYCHDLHADPATGRYCFSTGLEDLHPRIARLEDELAAAISKA